MTPLEAAVPSDEQILAFLRDTLPAVLEADDLRHVDLGALSRSTPLLSLPIDSLALMAMITELESRFRVFIAEQQAFAFKTLGDVMDHVQDKTRAKLARRHGAGSPA